MTTNRELNLFSGAGYNKGRNLLWQVLWHLFSNLVFKKYWFPLALRPIFLRIFGASVGEGVRIRENVNIHWPWKLQIGNYCWIGTEVFILNLENVEIHDNVCISQRAFICTGSHSAKSPTFEFSNKPIVLESSVWICASAFILPGSRVPRGKVVPANSTFPDRVKKDKK